MRAAHVATAILQRVCISAGFGRLNGMGKNWIARHQVAVGVVVVLAIALGLMLGWAFYVRHWFLQGPLAADGYAVQGTFGDSFAPITGFFTAMALATGFASLILQTKELKGASSAMKVQSAAQEEANRVALLAAQLACVDKLQSLDALGTKLVKETHFPYREDVGPVPEMDQQAEKIWHEAVRTGESPYDSREITETLRAYKAVRAIGQKLLKSKDSDSSV